MINTFNSTERDWKVFNFNLMKRLALKNGTPFHAFSRKILRENYTRLKKLLPAADIYYAVKANPHPDIVKAIRELSGCFDISSMAELKLAVECGAEAKDTIHSNPVKKQEEIEAAYASGVRWFTFDNAEELPKFLPYRDDVNLFLRIKVTNKGSVVNLSYKFGANQEDAVPLIIKAKNMGLRVRGLVFHVGSQCCEPLNFRFAIDACGKLYAEAAKHGVFLDVIDIGGGFPVRYTSDILPLEIYCDIIEEAIFRNFYDGIKVIAEPGRYICGDAFCLAVTVIGKTVRDGKPWYYIDDGVYGSFSGRVFDQCDYLIVSEKTEGVQDSVIAGPTCDSFDVVYNSYPLPELSLGDILLVTSMGAYTVASATYFNGFAPARIIAID